MQNHDELISPISVSTHFDQPGPLINDSSHPLGTYSNNRDSVRKAREAHLIDKAMTLEPNGGINRRDELNS